LHDDEIKQLKAEHRLIYRVLGIKAMYLSPEDIETQH